MNLVVVTGRIVRDAEMRPESNITNFTIAVDRETKDGGADFIRMVAFGKTAESAAKWLEKGASVEVRGHINTRSVEKDGKNVWYTDIVCEHWRFVGAKKESKPAEQTDYESEIPF